MFQIEHHIFPVFKNDLKKNNNRLINWFSRIMSGACGVVYRASYKGFADCIRLLLYMDAYIGRADKEGMSCGVQSMV